MQEGRPRDTVEPAGISSEYNGDAVPPIEQGVQELLVLAALIVLLIVFRTVVAGMMPIALALVALLTAFMLSSSWRASRTSTRLRRCCLDDRARRRHRLLALHRLRQLLHEGLSPRDAAAEAGASAGRATIFAGLTVAISVWPSSASTS